LFSKIPVQAGPDFSGTIDTKMPDPPNFDDGGSYTPGGLTKKNSQTGLKATWAAFALSLPLCMLLA